MMHGSTKLKSAVSSHIWGPSGCEGRLGKEFMQELYFRTSFWIAYKDVKQKIKTNFMEMRLKWLDLIQNHYQKAGFRVSKLDK